MWMVRSTGRWGDRGDTREEEVDGLAYALAMFGAEATLRHAAGEGTVTLFDSRGRELLSYHDERLSTEGGPFFSR